MMEGEPVIDGIEDVEAEKAVIGQAFAPSRFNTVLN